MYHKYEKLRDEKGLTDMEVARETGIPPTTLYDWKRRSDGNPFAALSLANMAAIAKTLEVELEYFTSDN